jgi:uncharacterized protein YjiS (DUF1127 family)
MTALRSALIPSGDAFRRRPAVGDVLSAALGLARAMGRRWRQAAETGRARRHLMQLDDRLLRDVGLARADVCFGDFETLSRQLRAGGVR